MLKRPITYNKNYLISILQDYSRKKNKSLPYRNYITNIFYKSKISSKAVVKFCFT